MNPVFEDLEVEELSLHPSVWERLKRLRVMYLIGHNLKNIPAKQI